MGQIHATAREAGIETISYIDEQTISFMFGMYRRNRLYVYGQPQIPLKSVQDRYDP